VLVVDDDAEVRWVICLLLTQAGYDVHQAQSGFEALKRMEEVQCEVVVTDYRMPHMNGLQLLEIFRARWPGAPVIVVSGEPSQTAWLILQQGGYAWLPKPYDSAQLLRTVGCAVAYASELRTKNFTAPGASLTAG
jgi:DNA-binding NtrC family response regulator